MSKEFVMWVVYDHPLDIPTQWVARRWVLEPGAPEMVPTNDTLVGGTLEELRKFLGEKLFLHRLNRDPNDDPCIAETWI